MSVLSSKSHNILKLINSNYFKSMRLFSNTKQPLQSAADKTATAPIPAPHFEGEKKVYSEKIQNLVNGISKLTLIEVSDLNELLRKTLNIKDVPMYAAAAAAPAAGSAKPAAKKEEEEEAAAPVQQKSSFKLKLVKFDEAKKVALIKEVKSMNENMNLVQAKKFIESLPQVFRDNVGKDDAEKLKAQLEKMSWFVEDDRTWTQKLAGNILKTGVLPKHVAIIMDGNRRYARINHLKQIQGHISGFDKLSEALNWCFTMSIKEVTVYAFSIENFKRSKDEVDQLFALAREKFAKLMSEKEKIEKLCVCIRVFGDLTLLPDDLRHTMAQVMDMTKNNNKVFLNVCFAYTSREEMTLACRELCNGVKNGDIHINDIDESLVEKCLYTSHSNPVDLLVRTSGEVRLSDFLLWQSSDTTLSFIDKLWPEFTIWNFYLGILYYQLNQKYKEHESFTNKMQPEVLSTERVNRFLGKVYSQRNKDIEEFAA